MKFILLEAGKDAIMPEFEIKTPQSPEVVQYGGNLYIMSHRENNRAAYVKAEFPILDIPKETED